MKNVSKEIEVIAYFDSDGRIKPLKFRIEEDGNYQIIKISKIISASIENRMIVFNCNSVIGEVEKIFEIKYDIENCTWILWKI